MSRKSQTTPDVSVNSLEGELPQQVAQKLTQDELNNVLILIQAGARSLSSQQPDLDKAGEILMVASTLSGKLKNVN